MYLKHYEMFSIQKKNSLPALQMFNNTIKHSIKNCILYGQNIFLRIALLNNVEDANEMYTIKNLQNVLDRIKSLPW